MIMITLNKIKACDPCNDGWEKILAAKGHLDHDDEWALVDAFESNDLSDLLWTLQCLPEHNNVWRKYAVWCALEVEHLMEDQRSKDALKVAWDHSEGLATDEELTAARDAAAWAAWDAGAAAAWDAAAWAAWAAWDAGAAAAWDAAAWAAGDAAGAAARAAARAAGDAQQQKLIEVITTGECKRGES